MATWRRNNQENNHKSSQWITLGSFLKQRLQIHLQDLRSYKTLRYLKSKYLSVYLEIVVI
jgi:hypothetical protein